jgi:hypothetical protein
MLDLTTLIALLGLTVGLGIAISLSIAAIVRRRMEEASYQDALRANRHGGSRYGVM